MSDGRITELLATKYEGQTMSEWYTTSVFASMAGILCAFDDAIQKIGEAVDMCDHDHADCDCEDCRADRQGRAR
jgi:hypothetical protein